MWPFNYFSTSAASCVSTEQLAHHLIDRLPRFVQAMESDKKTDALYQRDYVFVEGHWWTQVTLSQEENANIDLKISTNFVNCQRNNPDAVNGMGYDNDNSLTCRVTLAKDLDFDKLTPAQKKFLEHSWSRISNGYLDLQQTDGSHWMQKCDLQATTTIHCPLRKPLSPADLQTSLELFVREARQTAEDFHHLPESTSVSQGDEEIRLSPPQCKRLSEKKLPEHHPHKYIDKNATEFPTEDPIFKNNGTLIQAIQERPWPKMPPTSKDYKEGIELHFVTPPWWSLPIPILSVVKKEPIVRTLQVKFDALDPILFGFNYQSYIDWYKEHGQEITHGGTEMGACWSGWPGGYAVLTYAELPLVDRKVAVAALGTFYSESWKLVAQFSKHFSETPNAS